MEKVLNAVLFLSVCMVCVPLSAHHGSAVYDTSRTVTVKGTVTRFYWENPHVILLVDAKDESGNTLHWLIESQAPSNMANYGWTKTLFEPGDEVDVDVTQARILPPMVRQWVASVAA